MVPQCRHIVCFVMVEFLRYGFGVQAERDVADGVSSAVIPLPGSDQASIVEAVIAVVAAQMDADRKTTALKALQVGSLCRARWAFGRFLRVVIFLFNFKAQEPRNHPNIFQKRC